MSLRDHPEVELLLQDLLNRIREILGDGLVGLYLYGSLATGDFDEGISDFDLLAVTATDLTNDEFTRLQKLHPDFVGEHPEWEERVEIAYVSRAALQTFKTETSRIAVISPGEPFHFKDAGRDWTINWWSVRERGQTLFGPDPRTIIPLISHEEFIRIVWELTEAWREWVHHSTHRKSQAYSRLTLCRALYAVKHGEQVSKRQAALWAREYLPEQTRLIDEALQWRAADEEAGIDHEATFDETEQFVRFVIAEVQAALDGRRSRS